jgi:hypothetical protein
MKHRLRPQRSVSLPHGIIKAAMTSRNKVMQTCTPCTVVCRSSLMSLIMTFMLEPAKLQMNWARASGMSILRSDAAVACVPAAAVMTPASCSLACQSPVQAACPGFAGSLPASGGSVAGGPAAHWAPVSSRNAATAASTVGKKWRGSMVRVSP